VWIAELVEHGLVRPSFVPPADIRALRDLTRYRRTLVEERTRAIQRLEKVMQDAGIKLTSVASTLLGKSGRAIIDALLSGVSDPVVLAELAKGRLRSKIPALRGPLTGEFHVEQQMQTPCPWRWQAVAFFEPALWAEPTGAHTGRRRRVSVAVGCGETDFACRKRLCTGDSDSGLLKNILQVGWYRAPYPRDEPDRSSHRAPSRRWPVDQDTRHLPLRRAQARETRWRGASRRSLASSVGRRTSLDAHRTWPNDGDLRSHLDDVVRPVLRFWRVFERDDLDRDGESARNDLAAFLDLVEDKAAHYGQRRQERLAGAGASSSR
jgi:hypothetical protein